MESAPAGGRACLQRLRQRCPLRRLCARTYDVSSAASSLIGPSRSDVSMPAVKQPMNTVCSELLPPLGRCQSVSSSDQSEAQMEEENHERQQPDPEDRMELDDYVDPETGERAQG